MYEKAYGLDIVKPRLHETREAYKNLETEHKGLTEELTQVMSLRESDPWEFFKVTGFDKQKIFQLVKEELQYEGLPQDQRQALDARKQAEQRAQYAEQKIQSVEQRALDLEVQARTMELDFTLATPEVKSFSERFDSMAGQAGAFEDAVLRYAREVAASTGQDMTARQAVMLTMQHYGRFLGQAQAPAAAQAAAPQAPAAQAAPIKAGERPPVIPTVSGKTTSPTEKEMTRVEDLEAYYKEKYGHSP